MCRACYQRDYARRNAEQVQQYQLRYNASDKSRERARSFYVTHRARILADPKRLATRKRVHRTWYLLNRDKVYEKRDRRRAMLNGSRGSYSMAEWRVLLEQHGGRCVYCGWSGRMERDHRVPLSRGGANTIDNIVPACGRCNRSKGAKLIA